MWTSVRSADDCWTDSLPLEDRRTLQLRCAERAPFRSSTYCEDAAVSRDRLSDASRNAAVANGLVK